MSTNEEGWKEYADAAPIILDFGKNNGIPGITHLIIKEVQYRKTIIEQMGMVKIEHVIEVRLGKKSVRFVYNRGMVAMDSPQAKRIKHLSGTEKVEAMHRSLNDPANKQQFGHVLALAAPELETFITSVNAGKFTIVK
jgi:hypothetical protein